MSFVCCVCGVEHDGLPALVFFKPDHWLGLTPEQKNEGKISDDLCHTPDGHFFARCVLEIPIVDGPEATLEFGVWSSLSQENFNRYVRSFNDQDQSKLGMMFGWFSNEMKGEFAGSLSLKCNVLPQDNGKRPLIELQPSDHPLAVAQREGITFEHAQRLAHIHGGT